jgi:hypothetical protein
MIDVISLSIAIGAIIVGILSHIRHSECFGIKIDTRTPKNTPPSTPHISETQPLLQHNPVILEVTQPLDISNKRKVIKNWL